MDNRTGFRRRGPAFLAEQARQALGVSGDIRSLAEIPLPLVHTAFGAAVCAVAVLLRPQEIGLQASAIAAGVLAVITVMVLTGYDKLVYPPEQRPGLEGAALPLGAVVAFAAVLAGVTPLSVRAAAGVVAALVIGGVPQLVGRRVLGREGWLVRLLRDVWAVPGVIRWRRGWMVSVRFSPLHPLATPLQESFSALFCGRVRVGYLR